MASLKNITDLPVAESTEGLNLIVEQDGAAKRVAADSVGKVKTVNDVMPDENGNVQIDTASSWNDLKDKPFYEEEVVLFDGEVTGKEDDGYYMFSEPLDLKAQKYIIIYDGIEYVGNGYYDSDDSCYIVRFPSPNSAGNISIYPFGLCVGVNETHTLKIIDPINSVVKKIDAKYLPDPFWVEEKRTLVVEGVPGENGYYNVDFPLVAGKEYTFAIDGVEYTNNCIYESPDFWVTLVDENGQDIFTVYQYGITLNYTRIDINASHKIELVEKVYHTHHDFMVIFKENDDTGECDVKLVAGDFATAKAKILKGLPATVYNCVTYYGEGWKEITNYVENVGYMQEFEDEFCFVSAAGLNMMILPDNTITIY